MDSNELFNIIKAYGCGEGTHDDASLKEALTSLRDALREKLPKKELSALKASLSGNAVPLTGLLSNDDTGIRKLAAAVMGELSLDIFAKSLVTAIRSEEKIYLREAYIKALSTMNYRPFIEELRDRLSLIRRSLGDAGDEARNLIDEYHAIDDLVVAEEGIELHDFKAKGQYEMVLAGDRTLIDVLEAKLSGIPKKRHPGGLAVKTDRLEEVMNCRLYKELLFIVPNVKACQDDPEKVALSMIDAGLVSFLEKMHEEKAPFYFRVELRGEEAKAARIFEKKVAFEIERKSGLSLINSTSHYEIELRFVKDRDGKINPLLKLFTFDDRRFSYRKETVSASMQPWQGALMLEAAKEFLTPAARVLDPFCGVGTLLFERNLVMKTPSLTGVDVFGEAIEKSKKNLRSFEQMTGEDTGRRYTFITSDFFDYESLTGFDEIITDLPFATEKRPLKEIDIIYGKFLKKADRMLKNGGVILMFTRHAEFIDRHLDRQRYIVLKKHRLSGNDAPWLYFVAKQ